MTKSAFKKNVLLVAVAYLALAILYLCVEPEGDLAKRLASVKTFFLVAPAAWLAECFRRRSSYQKEIRNLYIEVLIAFQDAMSFTRINCPTQEEFQSVAKSLSLTIDRVRAHFQNFNENAKMEVGGLYPIEGLKTTNRWIIYLSYGEAWKGEEVAQESRSAILFMWQKKIRNVLLNEIDRLELGQQVSKYLGDTEWPEPPKKTKQKGTVS